MARQLLLHQLPQSSIMVPLTSSNPMKKLHKLYDLLQSIQFGDVKEDFGWVIEV